ncbi:MAG: slipin family protein [Myxococcales bacterium]|nr:slipin family protein [Myxococcales bacterium]
MKHVTIPITQRAILTKHGVPLRPLAPGKHSFWTSAYDVLRFERAELVFDAAPEVRAVMPVGWYAEAAVGPRQRGVLWKNDRPVKFLRPGLHRYWIGDAAVELRAYEIDQPMPELTEELRALIPANELVDVTVLHHQRGLKYVSGRFVEQLGPGRYLFWNPPDAKVAIAALDTRLQLLAVPAQELMTKDKVTLRLTLTLEYAPTDLPVAIHAVADLKDALYLEVQLAARDYVGATTLDELLEGREAMTRYLESRVVPRAKDVGVAVHRVGVKDVVLPGEMKTLLNRVIEAEKEAAANVITRREEAAATRSMANTARVFAEQPLLLELKRLETLKEVAGKVGAIKLVMGAEGVTGLLGDGKRP